MSSILRALKRIEKEAPPPDESHPWPRPIDSKKAVNSRVKKTWLYNKLIRILFFVIIIAALAWLVFSQRQVIVAKLMPAKSSNDTRQLSVPSKKKSSAYQAKISSTPNRLKKAPQRSSPAPAKPSDEPFSQKKSGPAGSTKPFPVVSSQNKVGQPHLLPKPLPVKKRKLQKTKTRAVQLNPQTGSTLSPTPTPTPILSPRTSVQKRKTGGVNNKFDSVSVLGDSQLKLQAIAWSKDAARRIVVINNRIVREGGTIDGFSVTQIREDDVIINDGTNSWRLEFSLKQ